MKKIIFTITFLIVSMVSFPQIKSILSGTRVIQASGIYKSPPPSKEIKIQVDSDKALKEAKEEEALGLDLPYHFGKGVEVNYTLENSGDWFDVDEGRIWKLKIKSEKAYSLSLIFSKLIITGHTELYIYNIEGSMIYGPITSKEITPDRGFSSDIIKGDALILELFEPNEEKGKSELSLYKIIHGFRDIFQPTNFGDSNPTCQDDVSCNSNWATQSNGVAMIILANMERICSGSLLNNACQDFTPNILTAFHCIDIGNDINNINACSNNEFGNGTLTTQEIANAENWIFRFQYKRTGCNTGTEPTIYYTFQGATFKAGWFNTDFALVEMNQNPANGDPNSGIQYLGWTRSSVAPTSGAFLGHPAGDVMKVSTFGSATNNTAQITFTLCMNPLRQSISPANTHWTTSINDGALERGSSGGPFFDQNNRIVGQLHGGLIGCAPKTTYAGRFDVSWNGGGNDNNRLSTWLTNNPAAVQTNTISIPLVSGPSIVCSPNTEYKVNKVPDGATVTWKGSGSIRCNDTISNPTTFSPNGLGTGTIQATVITACGRFTLPAKTVWVGTPTNNNISFGVFFSNPPYDQVPRNQTKTIGILSNPDATAQGVTGYEWQFMSWASYITGYQTYQGYTKGSATIVLNSSSPSQQIVTVSAKNACGCDLDLGAGKMFYAVSGFYLMISPNPSNGEVNVELGLASNEKDLQDTEWDLEVYDSMQALKTKTQRIKGDKHTINTSSWKEGVYIVRAKIGTELISEKLVVKH